MLKKILRKSRIYWAFKIAKMRHDILKERGEESLFLDFIKVFYRGLVAKK